MDIGLRSNENGRRDAATTVLSKLFFPGAIPEWQRHYSIVIIPLYPVKHSVAVKSKQPS